MRAGRVRPRVWLYEVIIHGEKVYSIEGWQMMRRTVTAIVAEAAGPSVCVVAPELVGVDCLFGSRLEICPSCGKRGVFIGSQQGDVAWIHCAHRDVEGTRHVAAACMMPKGGDA